MITRDELYSLQEYTEVPSNYTNLITNPIRFWFLFIQLSLKRMPLDQKICCLVACRAVFFARFPMDPGRSLKTTAYFGTTIVEQFTRAIRETVLPRISIHNLYPHQIIAL